MRKTLLFGCMLAVFLLLMIPNVNAIEYQNQKQLITSKLKTIDYSSFVKTIKNTPKNDWRIILKNIIQFLIRVLGFILEVFGTALNIIKEGITRIVTTVFQIIKAIISFIIFIILATAFIFIAANVIIIIIFIIWALFSSLPLSYNTDIELEKLINSKERTLT